MLNGSFKERFFFNWANEANIDGVDQGDRCAFQNYFQRFFDDVKQF